jgi:hypothetical protein
MSKISLAILVICTTLNVSAFDFQRAPVPKSFLDKPFFVTEIIDARTSSAVGIWQTTNDARPINLKVGSTNTHFKTLFNTGLDSSNHSKLLTVRINFLYLENDYSGSRSKNISGINLSFLSRETDHYVELFQAAEHIRWWNEDEDLIYESISALIGKCIDRFNQYAKENRLLKNAITFENIRKVQYIQPKTSTLKKGLYLDYYSFRDNMPDTSYHADYVKKYDGFAKNNYAKLTNIEPTPKDDFFGFYDDKLVHIRIDQVYIPANYKDEAYHLSFTKFSEEERALIFGSGSLFGFLGSAFAKSFILKEKENKSQPYFDAFEYILDPRIGALVPAHKALEMRFCSELNLSKTLIKAIIFIVEEYSKKSDTIAVKDNLNNSFKLNRSEYKILGLNQSMSPVEFEAINTNNHKVPFQLKRDNPSLKIIRLYTTREGELLIIEPEYKFYDEILSKIDSNEYEEALK